MKIAHISVLAVLAVAGQTAFAQAPSTTTTTTTGASTDPGNITSTGGASISTTTTATDTLATDTTDTHGKGEIANTGGEPQLMLMAGLVIAACGLLLRRKMAGQAV